MSNEVQRNERFEKLRRQPILAKPKKGGAIYVLPNLLTTGNLFFGYFSIVKSMQGSFHWAAGALLLAGVFDILDGRVARLTHSTSEFGVQYDSLCDLVSFGLAPAILMYEYVLNSIGRIGWIFCFIYLACGALRLARFNVQSSIGKTSGDFTGLPIPAAAGVIACFIGFMAEVNDPENTVWMMRKLYDFFTVFEIKLGFFIIMAPLLAFLMVSNVAYRSHKSITVNIIKPFKLLAVLVVVVGIIAYKPTLAGFVFFLVYAMSGLVEWALGKKATDEDDIFGVDSHLSMMEPADDFNEEMEGKEP